MRCSLKKRVGCAQRYAQAGVLLGKDSADDFQGGSSGGGAVAQRRVPPLNSAISKSGLTAAQIASDLPCRGKHPAQHA
jgi:hypothetical protein